MERILNDNYEDKYTRATVVYGLRTKDGYVASYDGTEENLIDSDNLYELARKGIVIVLNNDADGEFFPVNVYKKTINNPAIVTFYKDNAFATLSATDPSEEL